MTTQKMLSVWLETLGFERMSLDVMGESDIGRLRRYAAVILRQLSGERLREVRERFIYLRLV